MKTAHALAQEQGCVYVEDLRTRNMTRSAKETADAAGRNVKTAATWCRAALLYES